MRLCVNPACGLRYPAAPNSPLGRRCPNCLGETTIALEGSGETAPIPGQLPHLRPTRLSVLLDNIRSAWNVGSILRTADGFGIRHAYLGGISASPTRPQVTKTSLGAEKSVSWSVHKNGLALTKTLQQQGSKVIALEQTSRSLPIDEIQRMNQGACDVLLVVGNEVFGVDPGILETADQIVHLPMHGRKQSFNVAVAFALAIQALLKEG